MNKKFNLLNNIVLVSIIIFTSFYSAQAQVPACATGMLPANGGTLVSPSTALSWTAPSGTVTGYKIYIGTTSAATELVNGTNVTATSYTYTGKLNCATTYYWKVIPYNGSGSATGCVTQTFTLTNPGNSNSYPLNTWNGYVFDFTTGGYTSNDLGWTDYKGYFTYAGVSASDPSFNTITFLTTASLPTSAPGYQGCSVTGTSVNGVQLKRQGFPAGTYQLAFSSDDAGYLYINGTLVYSRTTTGSQPNAWTGNLDATSTIDFHYKNNTGAGSGALTFTTITAPTLIAGTISGSQSLCPSNSDPAAFTSTVAGSGTCSATVAYQWQSDAGCTGTFTDIAGATNATYDAPAGLTQNTCYRRMAVDANCARSAASNTLTVTVNSTLPGNPSVFPSNTWNGYVYDFSATGGYNSNDLGWTDYKGYFSYAGASASDPSFNTTTLYATANLPTSAPGYSGCDVASSNATGVQFKRQGFPAATYQLDVASDDAAYLYINGTLVNSRTTAGSQTNVWIGTLDATSTVEFHYKNNTSTATGRLTFNVITQPALVAGTISGDQTLCPGNDPYAFSSTLAASGGCGTIKYQWQSDAGCTGTFTDISGATLSTYDVPAGLTQTTCYRRAINDANCNRTLYTNTVTVTITSVTQGDPTVFPLNTWNGYVYDFTTPGYTSADNNWTDYRGFYSYPGLSTSDPSFSTSTLFRIANVPSSVSTYAGCQVSQTNGSLCGVQMKRQGFPTNIYQINFVSDDAGFLYVNGLPVYSRTTNGSQTSVWIGTLNASSTVEYRYKNNGGGGGGGLTFIPVTPTTPLNEGAIALNGPSKICPGDAPTAIVSTQDATSSCYIMYQWQADAGSGYQDIAGATSPAYTPASALVETSYRRKVTDACGDVSYTNVVTIFIGPATVPDASIFGNNSWIAYAYNQQNYVASSLYGSYTDPGASSTDPSFSSLNLWGASLSPSYASTYTGCQIGVDNHSVIYKRAGFPTGTYSLSVLNDDACQLYVNNVLVYSRGSYTPTFINSVWIGNLDASSQIEFRWTEGGGSSDGGITFTKITTPSPLNGGTIATTASTICSGDIPDPFTSSALPSGGCSPASYQWQLNNGSGFTDISGATATTYSPVAQTVTTSYRRKVTDACSQIGYSNTVVVTIGTPTAPDPSVFGSNVWNVYGYNDVTFTTLRGSYVDNGLSASDPSFDSRNMWGTAASPSAVASYAGCDVVLDQHGVIYKRKGFPTGIYRLDYNSDDAGSVYINGVLVYTSVSWGTLVTNIWTGPLDATSTIEYRWADTGGGSSYGSLLMTHPVTPTTLVGGTIANGSSIVCSGNAPGTFASSAPASGGCYPNYQWQLSTTAPGTSGFSDISGATAVTYASPATITATTYYRRKVTDVCGTVAYSNTVTVTVGVPSPPDPSIFGSNVWNAYVYDGNNFNTLYGKYVDNGISTSNPSFDTRLLWTSTTRPSLAPGYTGCQVGDDNHCVVYKRQGFAPGTYQIDFDSDDYGYLYVNGTLVYSRTTGCCTVVNNVWTGVLNATSTVEYRYREFGGGSFGFLRLTSTTPPALVAGTIGSDQTICANVVPAALTSVADATSGCTITYQWQYSTTSNTGPWTNIGGNTSALTINPPGLTATTYYVRNATDACGRSVSSNVVTVTVNPKPSNAGTMTGLASVCSAQTGVTYSIAAVANATTYTWTVPSDATITSGAGTNTITVTFGSTSGTVSVRPENSCGVGLTSSINVTVTPAIPANAGAISGSTTVCSGQYNVLYSVAAVTNAATYTWTLPTGATIISGANTNSIGVTFGSASGTITVTPSNSCGSATAATSLAVTVNPLPSNAGAITGTGSYCPNEANVPFSISSVTNATSYSWLLPSGASIASGAGTNSITVNFGTSSGNVTVTPVNTCGVGSSATKVVAVKSLGTTGAISGNANVCQNTTGVVYSVGTVTGASTYTWTVPTGATITAGAGTKTITVTMGTTSGNVTVTTSNSCQTGTPVSLAVVVTNTVPAAAGTISGNTTPCTSEAGVAYNITSVSGATGYTWAVPSGSSITSGAGTTAIAVTFGTTSGNVTVTPTNVCGNGAASNLTIALKPLPGAVGTITGPTAVCKETGVSYSISNVANALTYTWSVPAGAVITSGAGTASIVVSYTGASVSSGTVSVVAGNTCSTTTNSITVSISSACANTWTGSSTTDWSSPSNWNLALVPTSTVDVVIPSSVVSSRMPTISTSVNAKSVTNNGTITITSAGTLNTYGNVTNNGTFTTVSGSTVAFNGSSAQDVTGVSSLYNVVVNNAGGVAIQSALTVNGTLSLTKGVVTTNSNLTINFDNGGNIGYSSSDLGSISGTVTGKRNLVAKTHYIGVPFNGVTSAQVAATTPLYLNSYWKLYSRTFETQNWKAITDLTTSMPVGTGFSLAMPAAAPLIFTGTYNHTLSFTTPSYVNTASGKYLFLGNPYPGTLDWDNASGWTKTNVGDAIYYWDAANNRVASYAAGVGTNGATRYIPAMQAVLIGLTGSGGNASVSINNNARISLANPVAYMRTASEAVIRVHLEDSAKSKNDEAVIRFNDEATNDFDMNLDARKMMNSSSMPSVYTTSNTELYSINSYAAPDSAKFIPLAAKLPADGTYRLIIENNDPTLEYVLVDKKLGIERTIKETYTFSGLKADDVNRFELQLRETATTGTTVTTGTQSANKAAGLDIHSSNAGSGFHVQTQRYAGSEAEIEIMDVTGNKIAVVSGKTLSTGTTFVPLDLPSGSYLVKIYVGSETFAGMIVLVK